MAPPRRRASAPLDQQLAQEPYRYDFFQAVRLLERAAREQSEGRRKRPVGEDYSPAEEVVRFKSHVSRSFPSGSVVSFRQPSSDADLRPPEMVVSFMGMTGPAGVLPHHYTQLVIDRVRRKDYSLREFLDLFNHRLISHFFRAWKKHRFYIGYERARLDGSGEDIFTKALYSLVGMGTGGLRGRLTLDDETFLYYGGAIADAPPNAITLQRMIADYFELPTEVRQFRGRWLLLAEENQTSLPTGRRPLGLNCELGKTALVGSRVWSIENSFRIRLGPLDYRQFRRYTPTGDLLIPLCQFVRRYAGPEFDFDVQLVLKAPEVPWCRLGDESNPACLGWNTWSRCGELPHDAEEPVFSHDGMPV